jgi:hypothetical protein
MKTVTLKLNTAQLGLIKNLIENRISDSKRKIKNARNFEDQNLYNSLKQFEEQKEKKLNDLLNYIFESQE